jgi:hypothetical protein
MADHEVVDLNQERWRRLMDRIWRNLPPEAIDRVMRRMERRAGAICCINNCGGQATHYFDLAEMELRDGALVPWRDAGEKFFCEACAPDGALEIPRS